MHKLSTSEKLAAVREVINKKRKLSSVARKYNCSRQSLHKWLNSYKAFPQKGKHILVSKYRRGNTHYKKLSWKVERVVLDFVVKNPSLSLRQLTREVNNLGYKVSLKGVYGILARHNLQTSGLRHNFSTLHPVRTLFSHEFSPAYKAKAVEEYLEENRQISEICRRWKVSRPTFYKWLNSYKHAQSNGTDVVEALVKKYKTGLAHHRSINREAEKVVLKLASEKPEYSVHKLYAEVPKVAGRPIVGHHGIQNILSRNNLDTYDQRLIWAQGSQAPEQMPVPVEAPALPRGILIRILSPFATIPKMVSNPITWPIAIPFVLFILYIFEVDKIFRPTIFFPITALTFGLLFFAYSLKYYASLVFVLRQGSKEDRDQGTKNSDQWKVNSGQTTENQSANSASTNFATTLFKKVFKSKRQLGIGLVEDLSKVELKSAPFVSVHIPIYNEKRVVERMIKACTSLKWEVGSEKLDKEVGSASLASESRRANYEVVIVDDSTDETTEIAKKVMSEEDRQLVLEKADENLQIYSSIPPEGSGKPVIKLIHRSSRVGYKGAALAKALENTDRRAEYILVFDADFIPYPDTIEQFVKYFALVQEKSEHADKVAAIQGYQWHVLNKSENWITRGVRSEYAGSYVVERSAIELYGGLKMIAGSVYAIRRNILDKFGWGTSITEDFELTMRLYSHGYKVIYTPYIQAPAEAVATVRRLIRQRMRWAEGHSFNIKKHFFDIVRSPHLTFREKFEFAYLAPYYLQAAFFVVGTFAWFLAEVVIRVNLPFWTAALGWSLVFSNFLALPLVNLLGLFLEQSEEKDYLGVFSFVLLSYLVTPFQAYAAVKGFLEKEEGPWFRTPKTGHITDSFSRIKIGSWVFGWPFGGRQDKAPAAANVSLQDYSFSPAYAKLSAFNTYSDFKIKPRHARWLGKTLIVFLLIFTISFNYLVFFTPSVRADGTTPALEQQIEFITAEGASISTSYTSQCTSSANNSCGIINWDSAKYDGTTQNVYFEAVIRNNSQVGSFNSMVLVGSNPVISYYDGANGDLKVAICNDSACAGENETVVTVDSTGTVGQHNDIVAFSDATGNVAISYYDTTNTDLKYATCDVTPATQCDTAGEWTVRCLVGSTGGCISSQSNDVGQNSQIVDASAYPAGFDYPAVAYYDNTNFDLFYVHCSDDTCSAVVSGTPICIDGDSTDPSCAGANEIDAGAAISMAYYSGTGDIYIAYYDADGANPKLARCNFGGGSGGCETTGQWSANEIDDRSGANTNTETNDQGNFVSVAINSSGNPVVAFWDNTDESLYVAVCGDAACAGTNETLTEIDDSGDALDARSPSIALNGSDVPTVAFTGAPRVSSEPVSLKIILCGNTTCSSGNTRNQFFDKVTLLLGGNLSLVLNGSNPVVSFGTYGNTNNLTYNLQLLSCGDTACAGENDPVNFPDNTSTISGSAVTTTVGLFDTAGTQVTCSGSNVEVSTSSREFTRVRSSGCSPANLVPDGDPAAELTIQIKTSNASGAARVRSARLIITQADPTMLTETSTQVEMGMKSSTTATSYTELLNPRRYCFDSDDTTTTCSDNPAGTSCTGTITTNWCPVATVEFHATIAVSSANDTASVDLYDGSSTIAEVTTTSTTWSRQEDTTVTLTAGGTYYVRVKCADGDDAGTTCSALIASAKIVLDQTDATNGVTDLETIQTYGNFFLNPNTNPNYFIFRFNNSFVPANLTGTKTYFFEATMKASNASATTRTQLYNLTSAAAVTSSEVATISTTLSRVRSSSLSMPSSTAEMAVRRACTICSIGNAYTTTVGNDWLIIQIQSLPVPEYAIFALPAMLFLPRIISWWKQRGFVRKRPRGAGKPPRKLGLVLAYLSRLVLIESRLKPIVAIKRWGVVG